MAALLEDAEQFEQVEVSVDELVAQNRFCGNREYAMTTDLSQPLVLVQLCAGKDKLIDGNHRLYKAKLLGVKTLSAYYLTPEQHQKYIIAFERVLYDTIVAEF